MTTATKTRRRRAPLLIPPPETTREGLTLAERNGLRYVAGVGAARPGAPARLFPPSVETLDALEAKGLVASDCRPTDAGLDVLPKIGVSG